MSSSLYTVTSGSLPQASDVNQFSNLLTGSNDVGAINFAGVVSNPSSGSFSLTAQSGSNLGIGAYGYQFSYVTGQYKTDGTILPTGYTLPTGSLSVTTTSGNQSVNISLPTSLPASVIAINIYRTSVGGSDYKLTNTVRAGNSTFTDNVADGGRSAGLPPIANTTGTVLTVPAQPVSFVNPIGMSLPASGVETTIPYSGAAFSSSGVFTTPFTGNYLFTAQFYMNLNAGTGTLTIYKNGSAIYVLDKYTQPNAAAYDYVFHGSIILALNAGDTVKFTIINTSSSFNINANASFCAYAKVS